MVGPWTSSGSGISSASSRRRSKNRTGRTEPTVTIGKRLNERVRANVTTGIAESREVRTNVEWRLSNRVAVESTYDNVNDISSSSLGNLGADVRWRIEFE